MGKITINDLQAKKEKGEKITMLTAYDYPTAVIMDRTKVDTVLVGDSLGMVVLGYDSTVPVTMDEMLHHIRAVRRGLTHPLLIGDMPFMSYHLSHEQAVKNAGRMIKEGGCDMIKLEGGLEMIDRIKTICDMGIPVCGHIGLTPQTATKLGGYKVQGKDVAGAQYQLDSARAIEEAGASMIVFECIPSPLAKLITEKLTIPTIGIGAGPDCDGQVLVTHDLFGTFDRFVPKMAKQYINLFPEMEKAVTDYLEEVKAVKFPQAEHEFAMDESVIEQLKK